MLKILQQIPALCSVKPKAHPQPSGFSRLDLASLWPQALVSPSPFSALTMCLPHHSHASLKVLALAIPIACTFSLPIIHVAH